MTVTVTNETFTWNINVQYDNIQLMTKKKPPKPTADLNNSDAHEPNGVAYMRGVIMALLGEPTNEKKKLDKYFP